jgi:hypothetical protein
LKENPESVTELQNSCTLVGDAEEVEEEIIVEGKVIDEVIIINDKAPPPSPARPTAEILQDTLNDKPPSTKQTEIAEDGKDKSVAAEEKKPEIPSLPLFEPRSGIFPSWLKRLFGNRDKFLHDWESQILEAFVIHKDSPTPIKLPFGHQRLTFGLKQVMKKDTYLSWDQYLLLESQHHRAINQIVADAKHYDSRQRTFLALVRKQGQGQNSEIILVFFSLGGLGEAAHLADTMGRKPGFLFKRNRIWEVRPRIS